jgi:Transcriptional regulator C-terminal region
MPAVDSVLVDLVRDDVKMTVRRDQEAREAIAQFIAGGLIGLLIWWLNGTMRLSVTEINALFRKLAIPALKAAER